MNPLKTQIMVNYLNAMSVFKYDERGTEIGEKMARISDRRMYVGLDQILTDLIAHNGSTSPYSATLVRAQSEFHSSFKQINPDDELHQTIGKVMAFEGKTVEEVWNDIMLIKSKLRVRGAKHSIYHHILRVFHDDMSIRAKVYRDWFEPKIITEFRAEYNNVNASNDYYSVHLGLVQYSEYYQQADFEKASALIDKLIDELNRTGLFKFKLLELYQVKARLLFGMDRNAEFASIAEKLEELNGKYNTAEVNLSHPIYWAPFVYNGR